jgi:hypothetical protein
MAPGVSSGLTSAEKSHWAIIIPARKRPRSPIAQRRKPAVWERTVPARECPFRDARKLSTADLRWILALPASTMLCLGHSHVLIRVNALDSEVCYVAYFAEDVEGRSNFHIISAFARSSPERSGGEDD